MYYCYNWMFNLVAYRTIASFLCYIIVKTCPRLEMMPLPARRDGGWIMMWHAETLFLLLDAKGKIWNVPFRILPFYLGGTKPFCSSQQQRNVIESCFGLVLKKNQRTNILYYNYFLFYLVRRYLKMHSQWYNTHGISGYVPKYGEWIIWNHPLLCFCTI